MNSGIYKLTFSSGHFYIGKSVDFTRRWKEHQTKLEKGTAAKNMQQCYNQYGYPSASVMYEVHPDHIDVVEPIIIANNWGPLILNSTKDKCADDMKDEYLDFVKHSLGTLCNHIIEQDRQIDNLKNELEEETSDFEELIDEIKAGTRLDKVEQSLKVHKKLLKDKCMEIEKLRNRGLIDRIMNW